ncbi:MAG: PEP-CTERM system TPR-repeat protein PrsT [Porticoccaceae bacterium]
MKRLVLSIMAVTIASFLTACSGDATGNKSVEQAKGYLADGKSNAAVIELKNALQQNSDNQQARWLLGGLYFSRGAYADAVKELLKASELGQSDSDVMPLLAQSYLAQMDMDGLQSLSSDNLSGASQAIVLAAQGQGKLVSGQVQESSKLIEEAVTLAPEEPYVLLAKAKLQGIEGNGDWNSVRATLDKIFKINPNYVPAWSLLGDIELQGLNTKGAEDAYTKALMIDDGRLEDRYKRGLVRLQRDDLKSAEEDAVYLLQRTPKTPGTQYLNGILLFREGKIKDAVTALDIARLDEDRYPMSLFYLASAHHLLGNPAQAEDFAYRFLAIAPNSIPGRKLLAAMKSADGQNVEAEELIRPVVDSNKDDVEALDILAGILLNQGKTEEGQQLLSRVAALQPDSPLAQTRLGASLLASGDVAQSLEHIESALKLDPAFKEADVLLVSAYLRKGDVTAALKAVDSFEAKNPGSAAPHDLRGEVYLTQKNPVEARKAFERALQAAADDVSANDRLALMAIEEGKYAEARSYYDAILKSKPDYLPTLLKQAALAELQKDDKSMEAFLKKALESNPKEVQPRVMMARLYLTRGQPEQVSVVLNALDQDGQNQPDVINVVGLSYLARGDYQNARSVFERLAKLSTDAPQPHYHLAMAFRGLGDSANERAEFEKAIEMSPAYLEARIELTRTLFRLNDRQAVDVNLVTLQKLAPENSEVLQLLAVKALRDGSPSEALAFSRKAYEKAPTSRNMLIVAQQLWTQGEKADSRNMMEDWLADNPRDVSVLLELAALYVASDEEGKAIVLYERILEVSPKNPRALNNLAWLLREKDSKRALEYANQAVDLSNQTADTLDTLAMVLLEQGENEKARRTIERALSKAASSATIQYHSALISSKSDEREAAIKVLQTLLAEHKVFPERKEAEQLLSELK